LFGIDLLKVPRSSVPAITHVDHSARVQTIDERNNLFHSILRRFHDKTNTPVLINTSFNIRGEPIVCTPEDAYRCFMACVLDVLVLEHVVVLKADQPHATSHQDVERYKAQFALD